MSDGEEINWNPAKVPRYVEDFVAGFYSQESPSGVRVKDLSDLSVGYNPKRKQYLVELHRDIWINPYEWFYASDEDIAEYERDEKAWTNKIIALRDRIYNKMLEVFKEPLERNEMEIYTDDQPDFVSIIVWIYIPKPRDLAKYNVINHYTYGERVGYAIMQILPEDW